MAYKGHAANKKETTQIKKKPRKQKRKQGTHAKSHSSSQSPCGFLVLCRLTSWREALRRVSHRFPSCKRSRKRSVWWRVRRRMFCSRCGPELITDAKFCRVCGLTNGTNEDSPPLSPPLVGHRKIAFDFWALYVLLYVWSVMFSSLCGGSVAHETVNLR